MTAEALWISRVFMPLLTAFFIGQSILRIGTSPYPAPGRRGDIQEAINPRST
ncbi:hypothetical protein BN135_3533 [Cronobacter muytjensii 530]